MSSWGFYDDENDDSITAFCDIVDTEISNKINLPPNMSYEDLVKKLRSYVTEDKSRTEQIFMKDIDRILVDKLNKDKHKTIVGIALTLAKLMANVQIQIQPHQGTPPKPNMDFVLDVNYPEKIAEVAINCIQIIITAWKEVKSCKERLKRLVALNQELYIFSRGKLGTKGTVVQN